MENKPSHELVVEERLRQIEQEGHTPQADAMYNTPDRLACAAACYAIGQPLIHIWPDGWRWNPQNQVRNLVRAGALILAALDLARAGGNRPDTSGFDPLDHIKTKEDLRAYVEEVINDRIEQGQLIRPS